jgi:2,4-dienoyl-CoA reductase-like NADH-dependent reductase (Old Yellow Enzyme family)
VKSFFLALNTGFFKNGNPTKECEQFYVRRCHSGLHCAIIGNIMIDGGFASNETCGILTQNEPWLNFANCLIKTGINPGIQLSTTWKGYVGQKAFVNNDWFSLEPAVSKVLSVIDLNAIFSYFYNSTMIARRIGFKHIQLHAAHGYLLSSLLDPILTDRSNEVVNRILEWGQFAKSIDAETSVRISWYCGFNDEREAQRTLILKKLFEQGIDYVDLSDGYYNKDKMLIYPINPLILENRHNRGKALATLYKNQRFIISGKIRQFTDWPKNVDLGWCRDLVANPDFMTSQMNLCNDCGVCHYYSNGEKKLRCSLW